MQVEIIDKVEQGTDEWRQLRAGMATGSRMASILGVRKAFTPRSALLTSMMFERKGLFDSTTNVAMEWGTENEPNARAEAELITARDFSDTRVRKAVGEPLLYSPDGVDGDILLEVKCPYSKRKVTEPEAFASINDLPHYMAQIQFGMLMCGASECVFYQWAPEASRHEIVERDPQWWELNRGAVYSFLSELEQAVIAYDNPELEKEEEYLASLLVTQKVIKEDIDRTKQKIIEGSGGFYTGKTLSVNKQLRQGTVSYRKAFESIATEGFDLEPFRGEASESIVVRQIKQEK